METICGPDSRMEIAVYDHTLHHPTLDLTQSNLRQTDAKEMSFCSGHSPDLNSIEYALHFPKGNKNGNQVTIEEGYAEGLAEHLHGVKVKDESGF